MDYAWYLFSFEGRLNRARYWQAMLIIICWMIFLGALTAGAVLFLGGTGPLKFSLGIEEIFKLFDPASYRSLSLAGLPVLFFQTAGSVLLLWVFFATSVKRLHDRDKSGFAGYLKYALASNVNAAFRYEYFEDHDGFATGTAQHYHEVTGTLERTIASHLITRAEFRHDISQQPFFQKGQGLANTQNTLTGALILTFDTTGK